MTPEQKIKCEILLLAREADSDEFGFEGDVTSDNVDSLYETVLVEQDAHWDFESEFREGEVLTNIEAPWSRNYETKSVARKMHDGTWVGWTYWYGGGKYGDPESLPWMDGAYYLDVKEEEKVVVVRTFSMRKTGDEEKAEGVRGG